MVSKEILLRLLMLKNLKTLSLLALFLGAYSSLLAQEYTSYFIQFNEGVNPQTSSLPAQLQLAKMKPILRVTSLRGKTYQSEAEQQLSRVFRIEVLGPDLDLFELNRHPDIAFVEPVPENRTMLIPSDPALNVQQLEYLNLVGLPSAWDSSTGDTSVVIAIIDTGTEIDHEDLAGNIYRNWLEVPENGIDEDENGYVDDVNGWDFENSDPDPSPQGSSHGTHVAGIAGAATNNGIGIAGAGFNCRILPLKGIRYGYEAIIYAVQLGADVINCSWGSTVYSRTAELIVQYARENDALVVAAAGNSSNDDVFYPAGYADVLGVGSVDNDGSKSSFSNWGKHISVMAPGNQIYSTLLNNSYGTSFGTSMATPLVSGAAGLLKAAHPNWSMMQVRANIEASAVPVQMESELWDEFTGEGILQAGAAIQSTPQPLIIVQDITFSDTQGNDNGILENGEIVTISPVIMNFGITGSFELSPHILGESRIEAEDATRSFSAEQGQEVDLGDLQFRILPNARPDEQMQIALAFEHENGSRNTQIIDFVVNPSFGTLVANSIELSINSQGRIGFLDPDTNSVGSAFLIRENSTASNIVNRPLLRAGGILFGNEEGRISNNLVSASPNLWENDFILRENGKISFDGAIRNQTISLQFSDAGAADDSYQIIVDQEAYAFAWEADQNFVILRYQLLNAGGTDYEGFRFGTYLDFDLPLSGSQNDLLYYDSEKNLVVQEAGQGDSTCYLGAAIQSSTNLNYSHWMINNSLSANDITASNFVTTDGFTDFEKWLALDLGPGRDSQGPANVAFVLSASEQTLRNQQTADYFLILAHGTSLDDLFASIDRARFQVNQILLPIEEAPSELPDAFSIDKIYPNPFNPSTLIQFSVGEAGPVKIQLFDVLGRLVYQSQFNAMAPGKNVFTLQADNLPSGMYLLQLTHTKGISRHQKLTLLR